MDLRCLGIDEARQAHEGLAETGAGLDDELEAARLRFVGAGFEKAGDPPGRGPDCGSQCAASGGDPAFECEFEGEQEKERGPRWRLGPSRRRLLVGVQRSMVRQRQAALLPSEPGVEKTVDADPTEPDIAPQADLALAARRCPRRRRGDACGAGGRS